jgi:hypothetical protein
VGLHAAESALDTSGGTSHRGYSDHRRSCDLDSEEDRRSKRVSIEFSNGRLRDLPGSSAFALSASRLTVDCSTTKMLVMTSQTH